MLSSRYLHLHEALGLGPMWLNRGAKVLPAETAAAHAPQAAPQTPPQTTAALQPAARTPAAATARLAAMAAVNPAAKVSDGHSAHNRPSENIPPAPAESPSENTNAAAPTPAAPAALAAIQPAAAIVASICPAPEPNTIGKLFSRSAPVLPDLLLASISQQA
ncbi:hypothetical protein BWD09_11015, partial [Neisseria dentiae]